MIKLTAPDGSKVAIDGQLVIRARRAIAGEDKAAKTRVDWVQLQMVKEPIDEVVKLIKGDLPSARLPCFTSVTSRDGSKIWFDGSEASGPYSLTPSQAIPPVKSAIRLMGYRQYVVETPRQVQQILKDAGGVVLPLP